MSNFAALLKQVQEKPWVSLADIGELAQALKADFGEIWSASLVSEFRDISKFTGFPEHPFFFTELDRLRVVERFKEHYLIDDAQEQEGVRLAFPVADGELWLLDNRLFFVRNGLKMLLAFTYKAESPKIEYTCSLSNALERFVERRFGYFEFGQNFGPARSHSKSEKSANARLAKVAKRLVEMR